MELNENDMANLQSYNDPLRELALFAGAGGEILASRRLGIRTVCAVELDSYAASVLVSRQNDGELEPFPIWDDVRTFDGKPWQGIVDVVSGGFPCTDISCAGKRSGIDGKQSGLWKEMARIIGEVRPRYAFIENAADLPIRGLDRVLGDLTEMGFDAAWGNFSASAVGAPHERTRTWILATDTTRQSVKRNHVKCGEFGREDGAREKSNAQHRDSDAFAIHLDRQRQPQPGGIVGEKRGRVADQIEPIADSIKRGIDRQGAWSLPVGQDQDPADALRDGLERAIQQGRLRQADADAIQAAEGYTSAQGWIPVESGFF